MHIRGGGRREWGGWAAGGRSYFQIELFGVSISPKVLVIGPDKPRGLKRLLTNTGVNIRPLPPI